MGEIEQKVTSKSSKKTAPPKPEQGIDYLGVAAQISTIEGMYEFVRDYYYSEGGVFDNRYVQPYPSETKDNYNCRRTLTDHIKIYKMVVDSYFRDVFNYVPTREYWADKEHTIPWEDKDPKGLEDLDYYNKHAGHDNQTLEQMVEKAIEVASIFGCSFVIMDSPEEQPKFRKDAINKVPWTWIKTRLELDQYIYDKQHNLKMISFYEEMAIIGDDGKYSDDTTKKEVKIYRWWDETQTFLYWYDESNENKMAMVTDSVKLLTFRQIPVIPVIAKPRDNIYSFDTRPPFWDAARTDYVIHNKLSTADANLRDCNFPLLYSSDVGSVSIGTTSYMAIAQGDTIIPGYANPDSSVFDISIKDVNERIALVLREHKIEETFMLKEASSGKALQFEFNQKNNKLKYASEMADSIETAILALYQTMMVVTFYPEINYKKDFSPTDIAEKIDIFVKIVEDIGIKGEGKKEIIADLFKLLKPKYTQEQIEEIAESHIAEEKAGSDINVQVKQEVE